MKATPERITGGRLGLALETPLLVLLSYLYVWLVIDPRLIHHNLGIFVPYRNFAFQTGWPFLSEHLVRPGGVVEYMARLLSHWYAFGWAGALIVTGAAWIAGLFAERLVRRAGWPGGRALCYAAAAIVLLMHGGYSHPLRPVLSLLAGLAGFALWTYLGRRAGQATPAGRPVDAEVSGGKRASRSRMATFLVAFLALYQIAGAGSLVFPALVAVDEVLLGRRRAFAALAVVTGLVVPWAWGTLLGVDPGEAFAGFLVSDPGGSPGNWPYTLALYVFFPTVLAGAALWSPSRAVATSPAGKSGPRGIIRLRGPERRRRLFGTWPTRPLRTGAVIAVAGALAWSSLNSFTRTMLELDYHSQHEQWGEVLRLADRLPPGVYNVRCSRNVLLALCHTGRLGDEMCRYGLRVDADMFSTPKRHQDFGTHYQESRLLLEIGQVNEAEKAACEALEISGGLPAVLQHLAMISVVRDRPETARVLLRALARQPFQGRAAREMLLRLDEDPRLEDDPRVAQWRANMVDRDRVTPHENLETLFQASLDKNPHNRMAFALLMAHYLTAQRPDKVAANLPRLREFSYAAVPRLYQEACVIAAGASESPPSIPGFGIDPQVLQRANDFRRIIAGAASPPDAAVAAAEAGLGDSYFFYFTFGISVR